MHIYRGTASNLTDEKSDEVKKAVHKVTKEPVAQSGQIQRESAADDKLLGDFVITSTIKFKDDTTKPGILRLAKKLALNRKIIYDIMFMGDEDV